MHVNRIPDINKIISKTGKAVVALGCSFVQGQGAINETISNSVNWTFDKNSSTFKWDIDSDHAKQVWQNYPDIKVNPWHTIDFTEHYYNNSFSNILCQKYLNNEYACINLGRPGNGNRATIKSLYFYPQIHWEKIKELIVIFCPTGTERLDFIDDSQNMYGNHVSWRTIFPHSVTYDNFLKKLSYGYARTIISEKYRILELIANIQELMTWCKSKNAKLIITPAFIELTKQQLIDGLSLNIERDSERQILHAKPMDPDEYIEDIVNLYPWENMFYPDNYFTFAQLIIGQEFNGDLSKYNNLYLFHGTGTPKGWLTPCCHPSAKGHDLFAELLYNHITKTL